MNYDLSYISILLIHINESYFAFSFGFEENEQEEEGKILRMINGWISLRDFFASFCDNKIDLVHVKWHCDDLLMQKKYKYIF